jgi:hypothetical protein
MSVARPIASAALSRSPPPASSAEPLQQRGGGAVVAGYLAGSACPGQLGAVGLDAHAEGI